MSLSEVIFRSRDMVGVEMREVVWRLSEDSGEWPGGLLRLYRSEDGTRSQLGGVTWDGTPTIGADGVEPGAGPTASPVYLAAGKVVAIRVKMDKASTGLTGDEQLFGPIYARNGNVVLKWQGSEAVEAATWAIGATLAIRADVVTGSLAVEVM
jgi:hypothetical protein